MLKPLRPKAVEHPLNSKPSSLNTRSGAGVQGPTGKYDFSAGAYLKQGCARQSSNPSKSLQPKQKWKYAAFFQPPSPLPTSRGDPAAGTLLLLQARPHADRHEMRRWFFPN